MKRIINLLILLLISINLFSQKTIDSLDIKDYYLQKSKNQFTAGWILLGAGATMTIVGGIGFSENFEIFGDNEAGMGKKADTYGFIMLAGLIMDIVSIPVLISAIVNKKKASRIVIDSQILYQPQFNQT